MTTLTGFQLPEPLIPGSESWLATTSASQLCQITGSAPKKWGTRNSLWHEKRGTLPAEPQSKDMSRGHEFEPLIRRWFAEANPQWIVEETSTWRHLEREWQTADPRPTGMEPEDRAAYLEDGIDPDDPTVIANHEFMLAALREYGRRIRRCPPVLPNESGGHRTIQLWCGRSLTASLPSPANGCDATRCRTSVRVKVLSKNRDLLHTLDS